MLTIYESLSRALLGLSLDEMGYAREEFEKRLEPLGLSPAKIAHQSLEELEESLERVDRAISKPESFGTLKLKSRAESGRVVEATGSDFDYEIGILPFLLEAKKAVLDQTRVLKGRKGTEDVRATLLQIPDLTVREVIETKLDSIEKELECLQEQSKAVEAQQATEEAKAGDEIAVKKLDLFERRSRIWKSFLERESVATMLGGALLFVITAALIAGMFLKVETPETVKSAYLVILGYFFGQAIGSRSQKKD